MEQAYHYWGESGVDIEVTHASPYGAFEDVRKAAGFFRGKDLAFVCTDCMGYSVAMKRAIEKESGLRVMLPRTLVVRILDELFS